MSASDLNDARVRGKNVLEAVEKVFASRSSMAIEGMQKENVDLKEKLQVICVDFMGIDFLGISTETKILKAATRANPVLVAEVMSRLIQNASLRIVEAALCLE